MPTSAETTAPTIETLSLAKGPHRFYFSYAVGEEAKVLDALVDMVNRQEVPFDWFDVAVLSYQLTRRATGEHAAR